MYYRLKILSYITVVVFAFVFMWIGILKRRNDPAKICACVLVVVSFVWLAFETINDFSSAAERQRYYDLMTADSVVLESLIDGSVKKYALDKPESSDHFGLFFDNGEIARKGD